MTPDQIAFNEKIGGIFMPQSARLIRAAYPSADFHARFAHYTSADVALKIIRSKRLWMRSTSCMSDYMEVQHGMRNLKKALETEGSLESFIGALDSCFPGSGREVVDAFNAWWEDVRTSTYISSMTEHSSLEDQHGRLSMWRGFGSGACRVAVVLSLPLYSDAVNALGLVFSPVIYSRREEAKDRVGEVISNILENAEYLRTIDRNTFVAIALVTLLESVTCSKHEGFGEEREWRAIHLPKRMPSKLMESEIQVVSGVPQTIYKIPLDARVSSAIQELEFAKLFERLIIGPTEYPMAMYDAFVEELKKAGVEDSEKKVIVSGIPIRAY